MKEGEGRGLENGGNAKKGGELALRVWDSGEIIGLCLDEKRFHSEQDRKTSKRITK
jgi:hypothetical protein